MVEIPVADRVALVDDADAPILLAHKWELLRDRRSVYAFARIDGKTVRMHRFILGAGPGQPVDHRNHDGLDNRRKNLRRCTLQQNHFNRRRRKDNKSGLKGVSYSPSGRGGPKVWMARGCFNGKVSMLGRYTTPEEAHAAYLDFARRHFGEFACAG